MPRRSFAGALLVLSVAAFPAAAPAQEVFAGVFAHDVNIGVSAHSREAGVDEEIGVRSGPWIDAGRWGSLRGYLLGSVNDEGGVDFASAGAAWRWALPRRFYVQFGVGGAVQSGYADPFQRYPNKLDLGSRFLFEPELMLGRDLFGRWAAEIGWVHISNAGISRHNPGMDDLGARLVYRFGR
jgi:lipid A 3-O-deacylase